MGIITFDVSKVVKNLALIGGINKDREEIRGSLMFLGVALDESHESEIKLNDSRKQSGASCEKNFLEFRDYMKGYISNIIKDKLYETIKDDILASVYATMSSVCSGYIKAMDKISFFNKRLYKNRIEGVKQLVKSLNECCRILRDGSGGLWDIDKSSKLSPIPFYIPQISKGTFLNDSDDSKKQLKNLINAIEVSLIREGALETSKKINSVKSKHHFYKFSCTAKVLLQELINVGDDYDKRIETIVLIINSCKEYIKSPHRPIFSSNRIKGVKTIRDIAMDSAGIMETFTSTKVTLPSLVDTEILDPGTIYSLKISLLTFDKINNKDNKERNDNKEHKSSRFINAIVFYLNCLRENILKFQELVNGNASSKDKVDILLKQKENLVLIERECTNHLKENRLKIFYISNFRAGINTIKEAAKKGIKAIDKKTKEFGGGVQTTIGLNSEKGSAKSRKKRH